jgi:hypothetical protein
VTVVPVVPVDSVAVVPVVPVDSVAVVPAAIHSYISINGDKYFRNNSHCNYRHHWHHRHNRYSDH